VDWWGSLPARRSVNIDEYWNQRKKSGCMGTRTRTRTRPSQCSCSSSIPRLRDDALSLRRAPGFSQSPGRYSGQVFRQPPRLASPGLGRSTPTPTPTSTSCDAAAQGDGRSGRPGQTRQLGSTSARATWLRRGSDRRTGKASVWVGATAEAWPQDRAMSRGHASEVSQ
jgi:hypothetical protein